MGVPEPVAILTVQRTDDAAGENASVFEHPRQVLMRGTVEYESSEEGTVGTMTIDLYNVTVQDLIHLQPNGAVKLEAGYKGGTSEEGRSAPVSTVFYGFLDYAYPYRVGGEVIVRIAAVTVPQKMSASRIPYSIPFDQTIPAIEYGKRVMQYIGGSVAGSRASHTVLMPPGYVATRPLMEEMRFITAYVTAASGRRHVLVPAVSGNPLEMRLLDITEGAEAQVEKLVIDLDRDSVSNSSFKISRREVPLPTGVTTDGDATEDLIGGEEPTSDFLSDIIDQSLAVEFNITMAFDPRVVIGMFIRATGSVEGVVEMTAASVRHQIGEEWETDVGGPAVGGNVVGEGLRAVDA